MRYHYILIFLFLFCSTIYNAHSTHIRAGDITARIINLPTRTYEFTLTLYRNTEPSAADQLNATLNFGDNSPCIQKDLLSRVKVGPSTEKLTYIFRHSYAGDGQYLVTFNEENRNQNINNINDGNSVLISFYVATSINIDAFSGVK